MSVCVRVHGRKTGCILSVLLLDEGVRNRLHAVLGTDEHHWGPPAHNQSQLPRIFCQLQLVIGVCIGETMVKYTSLNFEYLHLDQRCCSYHAYIRSCHRAPGLIVDRIPLGHRSLLTQNTIVRICGDCFNHETHSHLFHQRWLRYGESLINHPECCTPSRPPWNLTRIGLSMYFDRSKMLSFFFFSLSCKARVQCV